MRPWAKKRVTYFEGQTNRRTYPVIEMRECTAIISNEFRHIFCAVNVSFPHFSRKRYGRTDGRTDGPTDRRTDGRTHPLIESWLTTKNMAGRKKM